MAIEKLNLRADSQDECFAQLKQLYPELFSDGNLNIEVLKEACGLETEEDGYYGLYWPGKNEAKRLARKEASGTLEPVEGDGVNEDTTHNIYIEGDNLEVLRILKQSYKGRVKMIFIDPPYNTGEDFIYPDNYKMPIEEYLMITGQIDENGKKLVSNTKANGAFHKNWLSMIYSRLLVAKELLAEDGIIFITIDDNEQSNLKLICDEIFGEANKAYPLIWPLPRGINAGLVAKAHETIIAFTKNIDLMQNFNSLKTEESFSIERCNKKIDSRHPISTITFPKGIRYEGKDIVLKGEIGDSEKIYIDGEMFFKNGELQKSVSLSAGWTMKDMIESWLNGNTVYDTKGQKIVKFYFKENGRLYSKKEISTISVKSILNNYPDYQNARDEMELLFNSQDIFSYPKPTGLIKNLVKLASNSDSIILDFFSGSATTAHAVMQLNKEDNGNRKFIMVQLPQKCEENSEAAKAGYPNICEIGKERIRRAGTKILEEAKANKDMFSKDNPLDVGFKVYRLAKSNFTAFENISGTDKAALDTLFAAAEKEPLTKGWKERKSSVVAELCLRHGFVLDSKITKCPEYTKNEVLKIVDQNEEKTMFVCLDEKISEETAKTLHLEDGEKFICLDNAIGDQLKVQLADKGRIETI